MDGKIVLGLVHASSICARQSLSHRIHYRIFPGTSDASNCREQTPADPVHMFWTCPCWSEFWTDIFKPFRDISGVDWFPLSPLLGAPPRTRIMFLTSPLMRRLLKWNHVWPPRHSRWIKAILYYIKLEKMSQEGSLRVSEKTSALFLYIFPEGRGRGAHAQFAMLKKRGKKGIKTKLSGKLQRNKDRLIN